MDAQDYNKVMVGCWAMWEHRNKVEFDGVVVDPRVIVKRAEDVLHEGVGESLVTVWSNSRGRVRGRGVEDDSGHGGWIPPPGEFVKINVDAGVKEGEGVGTGIVCRDGNGQVMWGVSQVREVRWEVPVAEAMAILDGLEEAKRRGLHRVVVESDCLQVIEALRRKDQGRSIFSLIIEDILSLSSTFISVIWSHTSRINNSVAHVLAHFRQGSVGKSVWDELLPPRADSAVTFDLSLL
ncbi:uncharacterized protein LOC141637437 [Silene latifolia]|uniref:uncharacterized protein LOC141637437 n=1 Tax=Silene latifolia TaxID=37657 RepID=UPI003D786F47